MMAYKKITLNGEIISYFIRLGAKQPLVFLHGGGSNHTVWMDFIDNFNDNTVVLIDFPGHGNSTGCPKDLSDFKNAVLEVLEYENLTNCISIGNSLGAIVSLELLTYERISNVLLVSFVSGNFIKSRKLLQSISAIVKVTKYFPRFPRVFQDYKKVKSRSVLHTIWRDILGTDFTTLAISYDVVDSYSISNNGRRIKMLIGQNDEFVNVEKMKNDLSNIVDFTIFNSGNHNLIKDHIGEVSFHIKEVIN